MNSGKEHIGSLLAGIDAFIKAGSLEQASELVERILAADPKNIFANSYTERISELLKKQHEESSEDATPSEVRTEPAPAQETDSPTGRIIPSMVEQKISNAMQESYKTLLQEIWKSGRISPVERERIETLRIFFDINQDDHHYLEQNVRLSCYLNAIRESWNAGRREFSGLAEDFSISDEEAALLAPKTERILKSLNSKGVILSLDDDKNFLLLVERLLEKNGYHSLNTTSGEEALGLLEHFVPDLVLCDIAFGQRNMNGFMFYEQFRSIEKFSSVPFIFISALNQQDLIKTGKKIGVDDYITKPVDNEVLLAAIEGRIRRSREMKRTTDY